MSHIAWTDGIGAATLGNAFIYPGNRFANWNPSNRPFGERSQNLGTGALNVTAFRDDLTVSLDITGIPNYRQNLMLRLEMHLKRGGVVSIVTTPDVTIPSFGPCKLAPGADVQKVLSDKTNLEYTFSTVLRGSQAADLLPAGVEFGDFYIWYKSDAADFTLGDPGFGAPSHTGPAGTEIITAPDQSTSPGGNHANAPTVQNRGLLVPNVQNGLPGMLFGPRYAGFEGFSRIVLPNNCMAGLPEGEVFAVLQLHDDPPASNLYQSLWQMGSGTVGGDQLMSYPNPATGVISDNFGNTTVLTTVNPTTVIPGFDFETPHLYNVSSTVAAWTNRMNTVQLFTTAAHTVGFPSDIVSSNVIAQIGNSDPTQFGGYWGYVFEWLFVSPARTAPQRAAFESYVDTKWALGL